MSKEPTICINYEPKTGNILEIMPTTLPISTQNKIHEAWNADIMRKILIAVSQSEEPLSMTDLKTKVSHAISTIHDAIAKLEQMNLIGTEITYTNNKKKILVPKVLCVTKNPKFAQAFKKFFQGVWISSKKTNIIIEFLNNHKNKKYTAEEISNHTHIPVDEVIALLDNWDSLTTRTLSNILKERPFTKETYYQGK